MEKDEPRKNTQESQEGAAMARRDSAARITRSLLGHVNAIAEACGAAAMFVYVDALEGGTLSLDEDIRPRAYYLTKTAAEEAQQEARDTNFIRVPNVPLTRMAQLKVAVFLALSRGIVKHGDVIVCLSGMPGSGTLDTILVTEVGREFEMFSSDKETEQIPAEIRAEVVERVVNIASELGNEGREGKPVGAMFVVGDSERVVSLSRQLIMNPFRGYEEPERNILDPALEETVKELSTLDGAFSISAIQDRSARLVNQTTAERSSRLWRVSYPRVSVRIAKSSAVANRVPAFSPCCRR
jgi:diadenylate cyclase